MPLSLRNHRALVLAYADVGTQGVLDSGYRVRDSGAADKMWWCMRMPTSGREVTTGMQPDHRIDQAFEFAFHCPVTVDDVILCEGESFTVRVVKHHDYGTDVKLVGAERTVESALVPS